jgi:hypothetical protein
MCLNFFRSIPELLKKEVGADRVLQHMLRSIPQLSNNEVGEEYSNIVLNSEYYTLNRDTTTSYG